jgi:DNA primase
VGGGGLHLYHRVRAFMISPKTIAAIRDRAEIVAIVSETVKLVRKGRSFVGLCPFHKEKSPSFNVNPEKGFFHCFGCKESGNVFDFVMKTEGLSFPEATRRLAAHAGVEIEETATDAERREADAARRAVDDLYAVNGLAAHWFETQLREHPAAGLAREELRKRGLDPEVSAEIRDALQAFRIGYAPPGWDGLTDYLAQQGISPLTAGKVGLIAARKTGSGHYDWFRHRLMFAILDVQGRVVGFSGRVLADPATGVVDKQSPKYINSPESPIYQKGQTLFGLYQARQAIRHEEEAILVEGNFDVVSLHARGIQHVVAPLGTAFTAPQAKLLRRYAPRVTVLFDGDAAGKKATRDAREVCGAEGLSAKVAVLGEAKDPDEFIRERGPEALKSAIRAARSMLEHLIDAALDESFQHDDAHQRAARVRQVVELIASENDPNVRAMAQSYADRLASRLDVADANSFRALQATVDRRLSQATPRAAPKADSAPPGSTSVGAQASGAPHAVSGGESTPWRARSRDQRAEIGLAIFGCFLDFPELLRDVEVEEAISLLEGDPALAVAALRQSTGGDRALHVDEVLAHLPRSIHTFAASRWAAPRHEEREKARQELLQNAQKLKRLGLSRQKAQVVEALHRIERIGDPAAEDALLREIYERRAREKHGH